MPIKSKNLAKDSWDFQVPKSQTTASSMIAEFKNGTGSTVASVDLEGDVICNDLTVNGDVTISGTSTLSGAVAYPDGITVGAAGILDLASTGNITLNTNKFSVVASSGNTVVAGTLGVTGNLSVNTNKVVVTAASGNTAIAGTLGVVGDFAINTDKATIAGASGNTVLAGSLTQGAAISGATLAACKGVMTWTSGSTDHASVASKGVVSTTFTLTGVAAGDRAELIAVGGDFDTANLVWSCFCTTNTIRLTVQNNSAGAIDPSPQTYTFLIWDLT